MIPRSPKGLAQFGGIRVSLRLLPLLSQSTRDGLHLLAVAHIPSPVKPQIWVNQAEMRNTTNGVGLLIKGSWFRGDPGEIKSMVALCSDSPLHHSQPAALFSFCILCLLCTKLEIFLTLSSSRYNNSGIRITTIIKCNKTSTTFKEPYFRLCSSFDAPAIW